MLCGGITLYSSLKQNGCGPGKKVGIVGIGGLGHFGIFVCQGRVFRYICTFFFFLPSVRRVFPRKRFNTWEGKKYWALKKSKLEVALIIRKKTL